MREVSVGFLAGPFEGAKISLVRWRVDPNEDAVLEVTRRVMAGPEPLSKFDLRLP